jgi:hypothetical protein
MLKKSITYKNLDREEVTEDFYFHLDEAKVIEIEMLEKGGLSQAIQGMIDAEDGESIIKHFRTIIERAIGKREGKRFISNDLIRSEFFDTGAYGAFMMEMLTDQEKTADFIKAVVPHDMVEKARQMALQEQMDIKTNDLERPAPRIVTKDELVAMPPEEFATMAEKFSSGEAILVPEREE